MTQQPDPYVDLDGPVEPSRARAWRLAVLELRYGERRRRFPSVVHVGCPGGPSATFELTEHRRRAPEPLDPALRCDVVAALLERWSDPAADPAADPATVPAVWLTRCGALGCHDEDLAWLAAARAAYDEAGLELAFAVVTHAGWYDPRCGAGRRWKRLRRR